MEQTFWEKIFRILFLGGAILVYVWAVSETPTVSVGHQESHQVVSTAD